MISEKEQSFILYWEKNREIENTFVRKLTAGLPMAIIFALPVILFVMLIKIFLPEWYMKVSGVAAGSFFAVLLALFVLVIFYAYFRMQFKWESNEQLYNELKLKQKNNQ